MAYRLTYVDNCQAWGNVVGRHSDFPDLLTTDSVHYHNVHPGMLVTSYAGQKHTDVTGTLGLGIVISVMPHPQPRGDVQYACLVLWNFVDTEVG